MIKVKVGYARNLAIQWVMRYAIQEERFYGAYFSGSTIELSDTEDLPESSDVDIVIVIDKEESPVKLGKFIYQGLLLEVTHLSWSHLRSFDHVLRSYHLAGSFRVNTIIADPTGQLNKLQTYISQHFAEKFWVRQRYENATEKINNGLNALDSSAPLHDQVMWWLFPTGVTAHVPLVAALKNPTIRLRYLATREVLKAYGHLDVYHDLLELLGCAHLTPKRVEFHLSSLAPVFDKAVSVSKTPFFFSSDITDSARPIALDGSRELIQSGNHREAIFWIIATFARCHMILAADASQSVQHSYIASFDKILADIGIYSTNDLITRSQATLQFIPKLRETAEDILSANPQII